MAKLKSLIESQLQSLLNSSAVPTDPTAGIADFYRAAREQSGQQTAREVGLNAESRGLNPSDGMMLRQQAELDAIRSAPLYQAEMGAMMDARAQAQAQAQSRLSLLSQLAASGGYLQDDGTGRGGEYRPSGARAISGGGGGIDPATAAVRETLMGGGPPMGGGAGLAGLAGGGGGGAGVTDHAGAVFRTNGSLGLFGPPRGGGETAPQEGQQQTTDYVAPTQNGYETEAQAADRQAQNPRSANFDSAGYAKNNDAYGYTGGFDAAGAMAGPTLSFRGGNSGVTNSTQKTPTQPGRLTTLNQKSYTPQARSALASNNDYYSTQYRT